MEVELTLTIKLPEGIQQSQFEEWLMYQLGEIPFCTPSAISDNELCDMYILHRSTEFKSELT